MHNDVINYDVIICDGANSAILTSLFMCLEKYFII